MFVFISGLSVLFHWLRYFFTYANTTLSYVSIVSLENKWGKSSEYVFFF